MTDTEDNPLPVAEIINAGLLQTIPVAANMGVRAVEAGPGYAVTAVPFEGNGNHFGTMYAGVLFTVAEILGGAIAISTFDMAEFYPIAKDLQIFFTKPAKTDIRAAARLSDAEIGRVTAEAAANGKSDFTLAAELTDADGVVVATTVGLYQLRAFSR